MSNNPYAAPMGYPGGAPNTGDAQAKVAGPAIGLMVVAGIGILLQVGSLLMNLLGAGMGAAAAGNNGQGGPDQMQMLLSGGIAVVFSIIGIVIGGVILFGALKMKNLESYGLAMTAAVMAMVPCISPCCLLGLPVGIWALVTLNDAGVKAAFR